jgi:hypothetical protein
MGIAARSNGTSGDAIYRRPFSALYSGIFRCRMKIDITNPSSSVGPILGYSIDEGDGGKFFVRFSPTGYLQVWDYDITSYSDIQPYVVNTWYRVYMEWDTTNHANRYRVKIDDGSWTGWVLANASTYSYIDFMRIRDLATNTHEFWLDDIDRDDELSIIDEFGASTAQELLTGGDGAKSYGWYLLNSSNANSADVNQTNVSQLTVNLKVTGATDFYDAQFDGPFLYKSVSGDFDVDIAFPDSVLNEDTQTINFIARDDTVSAGEDHVRIASGYSGSRFVWWGNTTNDVTGDTGSSSVTHNYLRMRRVGSVFTFYSKANIGDVWTQQKQYTRGDFATSIQVGIGVAAGGPPSSQIAKVEYFHSGMWTPNENFNSYTPTSNLDTLNGGLNWSDAWSKIATGNMTVESYERASSPFPGGRP